MALKKTRNGEDSAKAETNQAEIKSVDDITTFSRQRFSSHMYPIGATVDGLGPREVVKKLNRTAELYIENLRALLKYDHG